MRLLPLIEKNFNDSLHFPVNFRHYFLRKGESSTLTFTTVPRVISSWNSQSVSLKFSLCVKLFFQVYSLSDLWVNWVNPQLSDLRCSHFLLTPCGLSLKETLLLILTWSAGLLSKCGKIFLEFISSVWTSVSTFLLFCPSYVNWLTD